MLREKPFFRSAASTETGGASHEYIMRMIHAYGAITAFRACEYDIGTMIYSPGAWSNPSSSVQFYSPPAENYFCKK